MENEEIKKDVFNTLRSITIDNNKLDKKGKLTYLSWAWAVDEVTKKYPDMTYEIERFEGKPYLYDSILGYMVFTKVTISGETKEMWLPVMDENNQAMLDHEYTYQVKEYINGQWTGKYKDKKVSQATMFDVNKTIMRCLVKNFAMFGLGLYIYAGEDIAPSDEDEENKPENKTQSELVCENCGKEFKQVIANGKTYTAQMMFNGAKTRYDGHALCKECGQQYLNNK